MIRLQHLPRDAYLVVLPFRKVFEGFVMLSSTSFLVRDGDDCPSGQVEKGGPFIGLEVHTLKNILEFDLSCHTSCSILCGIAPRWCVGLLRKPFCCPCSEPSNPEWRVE